MLLSRRLILLPHFFINQTRMNASSSLLFFGGITALFLAGCGISKSRSATEQLLLSDAVDRTVEQIDFRILEGQKVYFDTQYLKYIKGAGFVNADYVVSSLRQQMLASGCLLQEKADAADYVMEARIGALGLDSHEVVYGVPASETISETASLFANGPPVPALPEISLAKKHDSRGSAKISLFAYDRGTRERIWQSGVLVSTSTAKDTWLLGAGPIQYGSIHDRVKIAGWSLPRLAPWRRKKPDPHQEVVYFDNIDYQDVERQRLAAEELEKRRDQYVQDLKSMEQAPVLRSIEPQVSNVSTPVAQALFVEPAKEPTPKKPEKKKEEKKPEKKK